MNTSVNPQITDAVTTTHYQQHKSQAETHPVFNQPTALKILMPTTAIWRYSIG